MRNRRRLLIFLSCIALVSPDAIAGAGVFSFLDDDPTQSASVAESGAGEQERQTLPGDAQGQQLDQEKRPDSKVEQRTGYGVGYEYRMKRLERIERPHRPERVQRPMRPSRPGR